MSCPFSAAEAQLVLTGPQPIATRFITGMSYPAQILAESAIWEGQFTTQVKFKNSSDVNWCSGRIIGTFPDATTWSAMHNVYAFALDNAPNATIQRVRIHNTGDGISIKGVSGGVIVHGLHMSYVRDDAIQNDFGQDNLVFEHNLVDGCYSFYSSRPYAADVPDHSGVYPAAIEDNLVYLKDMPDTYHAGVPGHAKFFKMDNAAQAGWPGHPRDPKLRIRNNIFRVDTPHEINTDFMIPPPDRCEVVENNIMIWGGQGAFPYPVYPGWTLTTDTTIWDNAKAAWLAAHPNLLP